MDANFEIKSSILPSNLTACRLLPIVYHEQSSRSSARANALPVWNNLIWKLIPAVVGQFCDLTEKQPLLNQTRHNSCTTA
jgi:hypothetical protein